jgi:oligopeptide/dipeptide ABC transporter ATP-binding protein
MTAMAMAPHPDLIVFDEPTTALDVIVQQAVLRTIKDLQRERGFTALLISHDLGMVLEATDRVMVMYAGRIVEDQPAGELAASPGRPPRPHHPYTEALLGCYADPRADEVTLSGIPGSPPDLSLRPPGCPFAPRCPYVMDICTTEMPGLDPAEDVPGHLSACWLPRDGAARRELREKVLRGEPAGATPSTGGA